ncbi:C-type lectin-like 8, partial [Homarus americanus]
VPDSGVDGEWQLRVEVQEGISAIFKKVTPLNFQAKFLTILIQPSRPDSRGRKMRRWPSYQTSHGVINLSFQLPDYPLVGRWTIRVRAKSQVEDKIIQVEHYFRPRFEVFVRLPLTVQTSAEYVEGVVVANMTNWRYVQGNCTLKLQFARHDDDQPIPEHFTDAHVEFVRVNLKGVSVRVWATVGDTFRWWVQEGWAIARLVKEEAKVTFLGDQPLIFRPGMPITIHVLTSYQDDHPLGEEELQNARLSVVMTASGQSTKVDQVDVSGWKLQEAAGVAEISFDLPEGAMSLRVDASLTTSSGLTAGARLLGVVQHSPRDRHLQIETSTPDASPGEFITLHVRNNFYMEHFNYVVLSQGVVIYNGREPILDHSIPTVTTFSLPASTDMSPAANILVWVVTQDGQLVSHALLVPVDPLGRHKVGIRWNEHKDHSGGSVEMKMLGETGAFFAVSSVWEETHHMDTGHELDASRVLHHMLQLETNDTVYARRSNVTVPHIRRAATRSRDGAGAKVSLYPTAMAGPDAPSTFNFSDLLVLTDADLFYHPHHASDSPDCATWQFKCLTGSCYNHEERCDGLYQCPDHSDEAGCPVNVDPLREFRIKRLSRLHRFYDPDHGDWAWLDIRGVGTEIQFDSAGPFVLTLEGPSVVRQWEQVGLRACVFNFHGSKVGVMVTLPNSDDYRSVLVEENGAVTSYKPRTASGDHQHVVWLEPGESRDVHIPIVFTRKGQVEVTVQGSTMMQKDSDTITIDVLPEGVTIGKHTSILLDLKNRALVYDFLDIELDESPIIPYSLKRRYIYDTPTGHISITGDVVGPAFPEVPVGSDSLLGLEVMGAETAAFNFASNLWSLHYLRLTNQIKPGIVYQVLTAVNVQYAALARYQDEDGAFRMWPESEPSVWLTAYSLKTLWLANFQDWENLIFIDPIIINKAAEWILNYQTPMGAFTETPNYTHPLDSKTNPTRDGYKNVSLTAQVVLVMVDILPGLNGHIRAKVNIAKANAISYLERKLESLDDPYDMALVAWALTKADSAKKETALNLLDTMKRKPFIRPKNDQKWDAHAVETTSYALLVYIAREGIGIIQENIVRFLAVMRELDGGLISTLDSVAAMEALVEYSFRARLRDVTDMRITLEHSANPNFTVDVYLGNTYDLADLRSFDCKGRKGSEKGKRDGEGMVYVKSVGGEREDGRNMRRKERRGEGGRKDVGL